nr:hypothetical protein [Tanacetum cinerariifolium]
MVLMVVKHNGFGPCGIYYIYPIIFKSPGDDNREEDPPAGSDQGLKRRKTSKDVEPSKKSMSTDSSKVYEAEATETPQNQGDDMGTTDEQLNVEAASKKDWFKKPKRPSTPDPEWNQGKSVDDEPTQNWISDLAKVNKPPLTFNKLMSSPIDFSAYAMNRLKIRNRCPFDLSKPLPLVESRGRQTFAAYYFFNNDFEYLRGESTDIKYTTSITKTKVPKYELKGIEDKVLTLWGPIKVAYDKQAALVRRADQQLNKFMEGDFSRLYLNDIEDMLLLFVQNKLFNLIGDVIVDLVVALRMFTRRFVIQKRVEDLQLCVESYQKKLNISNPRTCDNNLSRRAPCTTLSDPLGVIYEDKLNRKRLMRSDELHELSDGTLQSVRDTHHDMANNLRMGYNKVMPRRKWSNLDKKRSQIMVKTLIDNC